MAFVNTVHSGSYRSVPIRNDSHFGMDRSFQLPLASTKILQSVIKGFINTKYKINIINFGTVRCNETNYVYINKSGNCLLNISR